SNINDPNATVTNLPNGTTTFTWTVTNGTCSGSDDVEVELTNTISTNAGADQTSCNNTIVLSADAAPNGFTGTWSSSNPGVSFSNPNDPNATANNLST